MAFNQLLYVIGLQVHDTCNQEDLTRRLLYNVITVATRDGLGTSVRGLPQRLRPSSASSILVGENDGTGDAWQASNSTHHGIGGWIEMARGWSPPLLGTCILLIS